MSVPAVSGSVGSRNNSRRENLGHILLHSQHKVLISRAFLKYFVRCLRDKIKNSLHKPATKQLIMWRILGRRKCGKNSCPTKPREKYAVKKQN